VSVDELKCKISDAMDDMASLLAGFDNMKPDKACALLITRHASISPMLRELRDITEKESDDTEDTV